MRRKLIQLAESTLVMSLPSPWASKHGLSKGAEVEVTERGKSLVIELVSAKRGSSVQIDVSGLNASLVWHAIISRYVLGFGQIEVQVHDGLIDDPRSGSKIQVQEAVERAIDAMVGMELVRQSKSVLTIREISVMSAAEYPSLLRRVWLTVVSMAEDGAAALERKDAMGFKTALANERHVNRLSLYSLRLLHAGVSPDTSTGLVEARMLYALELMGDALTSLNKVKQTPNVAKHLKLVAVLLRRSYECWFDFSKASFDRVYQSLMAVRSFTSSEASFLVSSSEIIVESVAARWVGRPGDPGLV